MDPRRAVGPAHDLGHAAAVSDALERIGQRLALEALRVRQHVADGASRPVPDRQTAARRPAAARPSHWRMIVCLAACSDMPVRAASFFACASMNAARAFAISGASRSRSLALQLLEPGPLDDRQRRARRHRIEHHHHRRRRGAGSPCPARSGGIRIGPALEHQPLGPSHHAVDDRALEQCAAGAHHHPPEPRQPAALVQGREEPLAVSTILRRHVDVHPVRSRQRFAGIGARQSGAGRAPRHAGHVA